MPRAVGTSILSGNTFYQQSSSPIDGSTLGQFHFSQVGQGFRQVLAGASDLVKGNLLQVSAEDTNFKDMAVQAAVATSVAPGIGGGYPIPVTLGGTATATTSDFAGGTLTISVTPGIGQTFSIVSNDVQSNASGTCNFYVQEQPLTALTTSSKATVYHSPYWKVIQNPTTSTGLSIGGAVIVITAAQYGFIQTLGAGSVLGDSTATTAANSSMSPSTATAGAATKQVSLAQTVGVSMSTASVSAEVEGIFWRCF